MRWDDFRRSENVEDDRGGGGGFGGGGMGLPGGGLGIGTIIILGLVGWALGIDPRLLIGGAEILQGGQQQYQQPAQPRASRNTPPDDQSWIDYLSQTDIDRAAQDKAAKKASAPGQSGTKGPDAPGAQGTDAKAGAPKVKSDDQ